MKSLQQVAPYPLPFRGNGLRRALCETQGKLWSHRNSFRESKVLHFWTVLLWDALGVSATDLRFLTVRKSVLAPHSHWHTTGLYLLPRHGDARVLTLELKGSRRSASISSPGETWRVLLGCWNWWSHLRRNLCIISSHTSCDRWRRICLQCRRPGLDPWVRNIPWRREWLPTPVSLSGESHGRRSLVGYSPRGHRVRHNWVTNTATFRFINIRQAPYENQRGHCLSYVDNALRISVLAVKRIMHVSDVYGEKWRHWVLDVFIKGMKRMPPSHAKGHGIMSFGFCFSCNCTSSNSSHYILLLILRLNKIENSASKSYWPYFKWSVTSVKKGFSIRQHKYRPFILSQKVQVETQPNPAELKCFSGVVLFHWPWWLHTQRCGQQ